MTGTVTKGLALRSDLDLYDGTLAGSRTDSTGGTTSGLRIGNTVDVLSVFGSSDVSNQTRATIVTATGALGAQNVGLVFVPGTWTIDDDITVAANFSVFIPPGCVFSVASGKTLTLAGVVYRAHATYAAGSGTLTISGTDVLGGVGAGNTAEYAVDTGSADTYVIAPSPAVAGYVAGQMFRFKVKTLNTGASTLNVSGLGTRNILQADGATALAAGDLVAGQIVTVSYEGVDGEFHLSPTAQPAANPAKTDADNVYSGTETWKLGADVVSATALAVNIDGNIFDVTGTNTVTSLRSKGIGTIITLQFDGVLTLTHHSSDLVLPGAANIITAAGDVATFYEYASTDWRCLSYQRAADAADSISQRGAISGLALSNDSDADHDIAIAVGSCRDSADKRTLSLSSILTKRIDATWAAGDDAGGMFTGSVTTDTWYHLFLVRKTSDGSIDAGVDTSITAANIPSGYVEYRRIGSVKTDGSSNIKPFVQFGDRFTWSAPTPDATDVATSTSAALTTLNTPLAVKVEAEMYIHIEDAATNTKGILFSDPDVPDLSADNNAARSHGYVQASQSGTDNFKFNFVAECPTNTSSQVRVVNSATGGTYSIRTRSYRDYRGAV